LALALNFNVYSDALVVLGTAGILIPALRQFGVNPIVGYLSAGALLGPFGLGSLVASYPSIHWLSISDSKNVSSIAEFGIVFLLFLIGLEMTFERLNAMRRQILGLGISQWIVTSLIITSIAYYWGQPLAAAIILGTSFALSSTAIVVEILASRQRLSTTVGRSSFAILLAQDLAIIPLLMFVSVLGNSDQGSVLNNIGLALIQAGAALAIIVLFGRVFLRPLFRMVGETGSSELFIAAILFVVLATGVLAAKAGLSMALGAFVAGLLLAETEYRKSIETIVNPFKGLLLGVFFFTVGMLIDLRAIYEAPLMIAIAIFSLIVIKSAIIFILARIGKLSKVASIETALLLAPGGELAFVSIGTALLSNAITKPIADFAMIVIAFSMVLIPFLASLARGITDRNLKATPDPETLVRPTAETNHAIVVGHGRVGRVVTTLLEHHRVSYLATDSDARSVSADRKLGHKVYFGNATDPAFLQSCNIAQAKALIITIHTPSAIEKVVAAARSLRPDIPIISRARDASHARKLYKLGVNDAVPETIEASLQLSEAALVGIGIPTGYVIASIHEKRDEFRSELQNAAEEFGVTETRGMREKSRKPAS
jgi:monovalent cation:H+ antiporter-2, CPA2 family